MEQNFEALADRVGARLSAGEAFTLSLNGERSDFVRFNHGRLRQPGLQLRLHVRDGPGRVAQPSCRALLDLVREVTLHCDDVVRRCALRDGERRPGKARRASFRHQDTLQHTTDYHKTLFQVTE